MGLHEALHGDLTADVRYLIPPHREPCGSGEDLLWRRRGEGPPLREAQRVHLGLVRVGGGIGGDVDGGDCGGIGGGGDGGDGGVVGGFTIRLCGLFRPQLGCFDSEPWPIFARWHPIERGPRTLSRTPNRDAPVDRHEGAE